MFDKMVYDAKYNKGNVTTVSIIYEDEKLIKRFLNNYSTIKQIATTEGNIAIIDLCTDVMDAIKKCNFNKKQMVRISLWMAGYKECEIADMQEVSRVLIHNFIESACSKIKQNLTR